MQTACVDIAVITNRSVKATGSATAVAHIWKDNKVTNHLKVHVTNITSLEAELIAIHIGLMSVFKNMDTHYIIVITDSLAAEKEIISLGNQYLQKSIISIAVKIQMFFEKDRCNSIYFWSSLSML